MGKQTMSAISIIPLLIGSILLFAAGSGLITTKYHPLVIGLVCFIVFAFIEGVSRKKIGVKSDQQDKSRSDTRHE